MSEGSCSEPNCGAPAKVRGFCSSYYGRKYRRGEIELLPKDPSHHRLTSVDREAKTAICSVCGPTRIRVRTVRGCQCISLHRAEAAKRTGRKGSPLSREQSREYRLKAKFGITIEEYERMLAMQDGRCRICGTLPAEKRRLAVDHDHATGEIRGLLCSHCNTALGFMGDDVTRLSAAIGYLKA
ncbi:hypothetical protein GCM10022239_03230 [Leifsonia bigeumensis]|uniref:Recombination endonuclease VII n=1 Tax=Leifsonella bigeumensis TaxID=433643 RepID=A0ABP7F2A2_9MICO